MIEERSEVYRIPADAQRRLREMRGQAGGPPRLFTSDLSVNEFLMVEQAGFDPLELAMGNCVYHVGARGFRQALSQMGQNVEMPNYTQAIYNARELALERMQAEAETAHAHGIVGVRIDQGNYAWESHIMEFFAI